jgi:hypothetical protein
VNCQEGGTEEGIRRQATINYSSAGLTFSMLQDADRLEIHSDEPEAPYTMAGDFALGMVHFWRYPGVKGPF